MKAIRIFHDKTEAELCAGLLNANGITAVVLGAKEYASIITGSGEGRFKIMIDEADFPSAEELLASLGSANNDEN